MSIQDLDIKLMTYENSEGGYGLKIDIENIPQVVELINEFNDDFATDFFTTRTIDNYCTEEEIEQLQIDENGIIHNPTVLPYIISKYPIGASDIIDLAQYMIVNGIVNGDVTEPVTEGSYSETKKFEQPLVEDENHIFAYSSFKNEASFKDLIERLREYSNIFDLTKLNKINKLENDLKDKVVDGRVYFIAEEYRKLEENDPRGSDVFGLGNCELSKFHVLCYDVDDYNQDTHWQVEEFLGHFQNACFKELKNEDMTLFHYETIE